jgi:hypothetical protein
MEWAGETMRAALNAIASVKPDWLRGIAKAEWFEYYSHRVEEYRFPKGKQAQHVYGIDVATDAELLTSSQEKYGITLVGPLRENRSWQAKAKQGFSNTDFKIDWDKKTATCPMSKTSYTWQERKNEFGPDIIYMHLDLKIVNLVLHALYAQKQRSYTNNVQV